MTLDENGRPHISYLDSSQYSDSTRSALKYALFDGVGWEESIVDGLTEAAFQTAIAINSTGKLHISYYDSANMVLKYATTVPGASTLMLALVALAFKCLSRGSR